ncbi:MAG TPA: hypothetical protein ENI23_16980 [bacterium]|nr:hypothetical protein [bacterium]
MKFLTIILAISLGASILLVYNPPLEYVADKLELGNELLEVKNYLGGLAPLPGPTVEGTSTAGWTDDGSIVRLNTDADNVGIGTTNPTAKLHVIGAGILSGNLTVGGGTFNFSNGTATTSLYVISNGNIGIGTTTPDQFFSIQGNLMVSGSTTVGNLVATGTTQFGGQNYTWPATKCSANQIFQSDGNNVLTCVAKPGAFSSNEGSTTMDVPTDLLGIGTTSPAVKLSVQGSSLLAGSTTVHSLLLASSTIYSGNATTTFVNTGIETDTLDVTKGTSTFAGIQLDSGCYRNTAGECLRLRMYDLSDTGASPTETNTVTIGFRLLYGTGVAESGGTTDGDADSFSNWWVNGDGGQGSVTSGVATANSDNYSTNKILLDDDDTDKGDIQITNITDTSFDIVYTESGGAWDATVRGVIIGYGP